MKKKRLYLFDYNDDIVKTIVDLNNPEIKKITIKVFSGDEVAYIDYKNGAMSRIDSSDSRGIDIFDYEYTLLDREEGIDRIEEFFKRKNSYDMGMVF